MSKIKQFIKNTISRIQQYYYSIGRSKVQCNICGWKGRQLIGGGWHPNTKCPKCNSGIRQRLIHAAFNIDNDIFIPNKPSIKKILHFAPDNCLKELFVNISKQYTTADYLAKGYTYNRIDLVQDISDMSSIKDNSFNCLVALDVLEHVPNHIKALSEIYRILRKGGFCVLTVPQKDGLIKTYEDNSVTDSEKRKELFGQIDHLRIYGSDFKLFLEKSGFEVNVIDENTFDSDLVKLHVLFPPVLSKNPNGTNYRKIYFGVK